MDIRVPIGAMFLLFGLILGGFGLATAGSPMYEQHSLGVNINLWWGVCLAVFGGAMLYYGRKAMRAGERMGPERRA